MKIFGPLLATAFLMLAADGAGGGASAADEAKAKAEAEKEAKRKAADEAKNKSLAQITNMIGASEKIVKMLTESLPASDTYEIKSVGKNQVVLHGAKRGAFKVNLT